ncbi:hypothetical protein BS78_03G327400 [Paspalum vaginatum]|nr:hypothetical protein BS78_03G327400 [Paspalum vaginatum]
MRALPPQTIHPALSPSPPYQITNNAGFPFPHQSPGRAKQKQRLKLAMEYGHPYSGCGCGCGCGKEKRPPLKRGQLKLQIARTLLGSLVAPGAKNRERGFGR